MANLDITGIAFSQEESLRTFKVAEPVAVFDFLYADGNGVLRLASALSEEASQATHVAFGAGAADAFVPVYPLAAYVVLAVTLAAGNLTVGEQYVLSATPGKAAPRSDLVATNWLGLLFVGQTTGNAILNPFAAGLSL